MAKDTREGAVFERLFAKLETERKTLGGQVFNVLGTLTFEDKPLRELMIEAIRYGEDPAVRGRLFRSVHNALDHGDLQRLLAERALTQDTLDPKHVAEIREEMERREAQRLQPYFIEAFFCEAFASLGGQMEHREKGRYEISYVPRALWERKSRTGEPILPRYERICFDHVLCQLPDQIPATLIAPGQALLEAVTDLLIERHGDLLRQGAIFVDEADYGKVPRLLFYIRDGVCDGRQELVSQQLHFVELYPDGSAKNAGCAPYLDYRSLREDEKPPIEAYLSTADDLTGDVEQRAVEYALSHIVPGDFQLVQARTMHTLERVEREVRQRLTQAIQYWDYLAVELHQKEKAGKSNTRMNAAKAHRRAEELENRLHRRLDEISAERDLRTLPPEIAGGAIVIPKGLLHSLCGAPDTFGQGDRKRIEYAAMQAVMDIERSLGYTPRDVSRENRGYDIESQIPEQLREGDRCLRFIEVKGRAKGANDITVTRNEILTALTTPDFLLAVVEVDGDHTNTVYMQDAFRTPPDYGVSSVNYNIRDMMKVARVVLERHAT